MRLIASALALSLFAACAADEDPTPGQRERMLPDFAPPASGNFVVLDAQPPRLLDTQVSYDDGVGRRVFASTSDSGACPAGDASCFEIHLHLPYDAKVGPARCGAAGVELALRSGAGASAVSSDCSFTIVRVSSEGVAIAELSGTLGSQLIVNGEITTRAE